MYTIQCTLCTTHTLYIYIHATVLYYTKYTRIGYRMRWEGVLKCFIITVISINTLAVSYYNITGGGGIGMKRDRERGRGRESGRERERVIGRVGERETERRWERGRLMGVGERERERRRDRDIDR